MTIQARHSGICPECGERWQPGDSLRGADNELPYEQRRRPTIWRHVVCPESADAGHASLAHALYQAAADVDSLSEQAIKARTCVSTTPSPSTATEAAMSDVGFIPTTHQVREAYEVAHEEVGVPCDITEFDRWLNDIIRRAKEEAWDEALQAHAGWMQDQRYYAEDEVPNPHRADRIEQGGQP